MHDSFRIPQGVQLDQRNSRLFLPKFGWVRYQKSCEVLGEVSNVTIVSRKGDKWYVSIQTEQVDETAVHPSISAIGVDVGIVQFATLSNGTVLVPVNSFRTKQKKLAA